MTRLTRRMHVIAGLACLSGFCLTAGGCTRAEAPPASETTQGAGSTPAGQGVVIEFQSEPDPPASGDNTFEVVVTQPDGSPVTDATVEAVFSMPAMPSMNMPAMRSTAALPHQGSGRYRGTGQLSMGGTWNVIVTATRGGQEVGARRFSIVVK